jgi:hypothetical protein
MGLFVRSLLSNLDLLDGNLLVMPKG